MTTLNFSNIDNDALTMVNTCLNSVLKLASVERVLKAYNDKVKAGEEELNEEHKEALRKDVSTTRKQAQMQCNGLFTRYMKTEDFLAGNLFNYDIEAFLRNIGVLAGDLDNAKKSTLKKVEAFRTLVTDRSITRRAKGTSILATKEYKNDIIEAFLALLTGLEASGALVYGKDGLEKRDFSK